MYNFAQCTNKKCERYSTCKRPKGVYVEANYKAICNQKNSYIWYVKENVDITIYNK